VALNLSRAGRALNQVGRAETLSGDNIGTGNHVMARKGNASTRRSSNLSPEQMRAAIPVLETRVKELREFDPQSISKGSDPQVQALAARIMSTLSRIYGEDTLEFGRLKEAADLDDTVYIGALYIGPGSGPVGPSVQEIRAGVERGRSRAIALLEGEASSLREALALYGSHDTRDHSGSGSDGKPPNDDIFIVHGRDGPAKTEVARLIERAGLKAVILHEQPNSGRTIIEKFEDHGGAAGFAVVVVTPDDLGGLDIAQLRPRARQNVIGEMFWFAGRLGRNRVCALIKGDIEMPSDFAGVGYTDMDERGAWKAELLKELVAAGYTVDWAKAMA
jgi:predicted nucleotide-binding protein